MPTPRLLEHKSVLRKSKYASVNVYDKDEVFSNKTDKSIKSKKSVQFDASVKIRKRKPSRPSKEFKPEDS